MQVFDSVTNESGLTCEIHRITNSTKTDPFMGGDSSNPNWEEYLNSFKDQYKPHILLIKKSIEENRLIGENASHYANEICFKFSDGECWSFTWRAWGDLMQAIVNKKEGYMAYYI